MLTCFRYPVLSGLQTRFAILVDKANKLEKMHLKKLEEFDELKRRYETLKEKVENEKVEYTNLSSTHKNLTDQIGKWEKMRGK